MIGQLARLTVRANQEARFTIRRREASIQITPLRPRMARGRAGPLQVAHFP
jgi:hypothetical protein